MPRTIYIYYSKPPRLHPMARSECEMTIQEIQQKMTETSFAEADLSKENPINFIDDVRIRVCVIALRTSSSLHSRAKGARVINVPCAQTKQNPKSSYRTQSRRS